MELCGILRLQNNLQNVLEYEQYFSVVNLYGSYTQSHLSQYRSNKSNYCIVF